MRAGLDRDRGQHRINLAPENTFEIIMLRRFQLVAADAFDARRDERRLQFLQQAFILLGHQLFGALGNLGQLLRGAQAVGADYVFAFVLQLLQAADADHEKLVEVGTADGEEFDAFQQGQRGVAGFFKHARVELDPTEFAIQESGFRSAHGEWCRRRSTRCGE